MGPARVLVVDDDEIVRITLSDVLASEGYEVMSAANVPDALRLIVSTEFDLLLTDLHMPGTGDGLTLISAMRHSNPGAVTMLLSAFPEMDAAARAIMIQTDEILVKPMDLISLISSVKERLAEGPHAARIVESVAMILERSVENIIEDWYKQIQTEPSLMAVPMTRELRCGHLPKLFRDLVHRLDFVKDLGTKELVSSSAAAHGRLRSRQGYNAAMLVEESRQLQVCIFRGLQQSRDTIDYSVVLLGVMTIADEIDSQLSQAMTSYTADSIAGRAQVSSGSYADKSGPG